MKLAIMQPYFFPYIGYFQLIHAVDAFVLLDDVNFIKSGWMNRNRILVNGAPHMVTLPVEAISQNRHIRDTKIAQGYGTWRSAFLKTLGRAYGKAPFFNDVFPMMQRICDSETTDLTAYLEMSIRAMCSYVGIKTPLYRSSQGGVHKDLSGQERIIAICGQYGADVYINSPGGRELYDKQAFKEQGIDLLFLVPEVSTYSQGVHSFISHLSIIDIAMYNSQQTMHEMVARYSLDNVEQVCI
jgi:hypothetical protein